MTGGNLFRLALYFFTALFILLPVSCGKKTDYGDPESVLRGFADARTTEARRDFMNRESAGRAGSESEIYAFPFYVFGADTRWVVTGKGTEGDNAWLKLKITAHATENIMGNETVVRFSREKGVWLIDLRSFTDRDGVYTGKTGPVEYIKNLGRQ
jgi:hypothetical protein